MSGEEGSGGREEPEEGIDVPETRPFLSAPDGDDGGATQRSSRESLPHVHHHPQHHHHEHVDEQELVDDETMSCSQSTHTSSTSPTFTGGSSGSLRPCCRICQISEAGDRLISPCRCSGTLQFVHRKCLVYCGRLHVPRCTGSDLVLHLVFILVLLLMLACATLSVIYLKADKDYRLRTSLNVDDVIVITCSVLFFVSFFVAVFTQYRAEASIFRLCFRLWIINKHWRIRDYSRSLDTQDFPTS